jgi:hypothetical protein
LEKPYTQPINILHYNPFPETDSKSVDKNIWDALTLKEKRNWIKKNTNFDILVEDPTTIMPDKPPIPVDPVQIPQTTESGQPQNKFQDFLFTNYPQGAKDNAQKALDFRNKTNSQCGTKMGWQFCEDLISGRPLNFKQIKKLYNYLGKNREFSNGIFSESCNSILFSAWGGLDMFNWAENQIISINE